MRAARVASFLKNSCNDIRILGVFYVRNRLRALKNLENGFSDPTSVQKAIEIAKIRFWSWFGVREACSRFFNALNRFLA
jgi:hypothetical protein